MNHSIENNAVGEITKRLERLQDSQELGQIINLLYSDLRRIAGNLARDEATLQPTALINEVYVYLTGREQLFFENRKHFLNTAALIMRQLLIRYARAKRTEKRGGGEVHVPLDEAWMARKLDLEPDVLLALEQAFERLEELDQRKYRIAVLRHFLGLSVDEIAENLQLHPRTVRRDWQFCRTWLTREIQATS